jgi:hypothetical protein
MQPTFLPWSGYFNLLAQAEDFIFLDDVQLEKQSWQTRNRIFLNGTQPTWISVPVLHERLAQSIIETKILDAAHWQKKLVRGLTQFYSKHPYYYDACEILDMLSNNSHMRLASLNESIIIFIASRLELNAKIHRASELGITGVRSKRLTSFCDHFKAKEYLSPQGSATYLKEDAFDTTTTARLRLQDYQPRPYSQKGSKDFISHLSILDVLANLGWKKTREYVYNGEIK